MVSELSDADVLTQDLGDSLPEKTKPPGAHWTATKDAAGGSAGNPGPKRAT
jgi:hypothetical protein